MERRKVPNIETRISPADNNLDVIRKLKRFVETLTVDDDKIRKFYIGIASGVDYDHALRRRYDKKKQAWEITDMYAIYQAEAQEYCRVLEPDLERCFRSVNADRVEMDSPDQPDGDGLPENLNGAAGGAGRRSGQPHHFVYVAVKRLGK